MKRTVLFAFLVLGTMALPAQERTAPTVGARGPAGGIIVYDKGTPDGGWQYLEAAPGDLPEVPWFNGKDGVETGAVGTSVGTGKANTEAILGTLGPGNYAASACAGYTGGGFSDWFLPSKDELALVRQALRTVNGELFSVAYYWSSSEYNPEDSWVQFWGTAGGQFHNLKGFPHPVWPVRYF